MESKINFNLSDKKQSIRYKSEERKSNNLSRNFTISNNKMNKKFESSLRVIKAKILLKLDPLLILIKINYIYLFLRQMLTIIKILIQQKKQKNFFLLKNIIIL